MEASSGLLDPKPGVALRDVERMANRVALGLTVVLWFVATAVAYRRVVGALDEPLGVLPLAVTGIVIAAVALAIRVLGSTARTTLRATPAHMALLVLPSAAMVLLAISIALPDTSPTGGMLFCAPLLVVEVAVWRRRSAPRNRSAERTDNEPRRDIETEPVRGALELAPIADDQIDQQLIRRSGDATETIEGSLRVPFEPGQRSAWAHLAFCPQFEVTPKITVTQRSGPPARVTVGRLLPYGARFDLKLSSAGEIGQSIVLSFKVSCRLRGDGESG